MKKPRTLLVTGLLVAGTISVAHDGVQNPLVKARMDGMTELAENTKILGQMAQGKTAFDIEKARLAAERLAEHASQTTTLFAEPADDPKSEALPVIWENFEDFTAKTDALVEAALAAKDAIDDRSSLQMAVQTIGGTCRACHQIYRE